MGVVLSSSNQTNTLPHPHPPYNKPIDLSIAYQQDNSLGFLNYLLWVL